MKDDNIQKEFKYINKNVKKTKKLEKKEIDVLERLKVTYAKQ